MAGKNKTPSGLICPRLPAAVAGVVVVVAAARLPDLTGDGDPVEAGLVPLLARVHQLVHVGGEGELAALGHLPIQGGGVRAQHLDLEEAGVAGAVGVGGGVLGQRVARSPPGRGWSPWCGWPPSAPSPTPSGTASSWSWGTASSPA